MVEHYGDFKGKRILITGHTGFKGGWLSHILSEMGATLYGYAQPPHTQPSLYESSGVSPLFEREWLADLRRGDLVRGAVMESSPEIVFHLAAQPSVLASYAHPVETFETNIIGTVHLLEALRALEHDLSLIHI